jgi:hypothetical protein
MVAGILGTELEAISSLFTGSLRYHFTQSNMQ